MPDMFKQRLNYCDTQIDKLFQGLILNEEATIQLQAIKRHYHSMYFNAGKSGERVIEMYELFVTTLQQVRNNKITLKEGIDRIEQKAAARENAIFWNNGFNGLSLAFLFLLATATYLSLYVMIASCFPLQPIIGFAVFVLATELFVKKMNEVLNGFFEFETYAPIKDECIREVSVMSFFKSAPVETPSLNRELSLVENSL
ncbi:DUF5638 domain-containing protein [Legionella saoudiensis]|uniref:DUF5638 domain-containing protein n=1 Tax=Legionella saoudiensis TaxID=1750561 RepID=UPI00073143FA|nr:DUF5638 domain-containing protein [Legionella saoudiensis]